VGVSHLTRGDRSCWWALYRFLRVFDYVSLSWNKLHAKIYQIWSKTDIWSFFNSEFLYQQYFVFLLFSGSRNYSIVNLNSRPGKDSWYQGYCTCWPLSKFDHCCRTPPWGSLRLRSVMRYRQGSGGGRRFIVRHAREYTHGKQTDQKLVVYCKICHSYIPQKLVRVSLQYESIQAPWLPITHIPLVFRDSYTIECHYARVPGIRRKFVNAS